MSKYVINFFGEGTFEALNRCRHWLKSHGYSYGSSDITEYIGVLKGSYYIAKWRNLTDSEREQLDGYITGDFRDGPVTLALKSTPNNWSIKNEKSLVKRCIRRWRVRLASDPLLQNKRLFKRRTREMGVITASIFIDDLITTTAKQGLCNYDSVHRPDLDNYISEFKNELLEHIAEDLKLISNKEIDDSINEEISEWR